MNERLRFTNRGSISLQSYMLPGVEKAVFGVRKPYSYS
jgi:hypothetical protein